MEFVRGLALIGSVKPFLTAQPEFNRPGMIAPAGVGDRNPWRTTAAVRHAAEDKLPRRQICAVFCIESNCFFTGAKAAVKTEVVN